MSRPRSSTKSPQTGKTGGRGTPGGRRQATDGVSPKKAVPRRTKAEADQLRAQLPDEHARYAELWDRGAGKAHATRAAQPLRVALRSAHKKRLARIEAQTGLDRQTILNRAVAAGWEALCMNGTPLDVAAARLRRQPSATAGTVTLHPTTATLRILREAGHPRARAILLQTGLNVWSAA